MTNTLQVNISKKIGTFQLNVELSITPGIHALFGSSGSGKTQTLECIAGLTQPDSGTIILKDRDIHTLPARERKIGYVFQDGALFPHMTITQNTSYSRRNEKGQGQSEAKSILNEMGVGHLADRYPHEISGGQKQRVAIARALVAEPDILLLDEPFSNLDSVVRAKIMNDLLDLVERRNILAILVSHNLEEIIHTAHSLSIIEDGRIIQSGFINDIIFNPASGEVARLLGDVNLLDGEIKHTEPDGFTVDVMGTTWESSPRLTGKIGQKIELGIRTSSVKILKPNLKVPPELQKNQKSSTVQKVYHYPDFCIVDLMVEDCIPLTAKITESTSERLGIKEGGTIEISVPPPEMLIFEQKVFM
ncbi:MAG: ABC transporter ATP-binding protein [Candidatus Lindowbacteria bacterium]|nr:ABC transporter ATP-binding protein [Candidatus Lindowbacteria bacterium]